MIMEQESENEHLLTFELTTDNGEIEIHGDEAGLRFLIDAITKVIENRTHDHLMTPSWAGYELSENTQGVDNSLINKVTINLLKD